MTLEIKNVLDANYNAWELSFPATWDEFSAIFFLRYAPTDCCALLRPCPDGLSFENAPPPPLPKVVSAIYIWYILIDLVTRGAECARSLILYSTFLKIATFPRLRPGFDSRHLIKKTETYTVVWKMI